MTSQFLNEFGLLNSKINEGVAENSPLWSWEYLLMRWDADLFVDLLFFIDACETDVPGLYNQRPFKNGSPEDYMSPDQLIAFAAALKHGKRHKELNDMWSYLKSHWFTYDNQSKGTNKDRLMQPSAICFVGALAGNKLCKLLLVPMFMHSSIVRKNETSGRLKTWTMLMTLRMTRTKKLCSKLLSKFSAFKTWSGCFLEYFPKIGHPIREIASGRKL